MKLEAGPKRVRTSKDPTQSWEKILLVNLRLIFASKSCKYNL